MTETLADIDLLDPASFADGPPHGYFDWLRRENPVQGRPNPLLGGTIWNLTRFRDIREVGNDTATFTNSQGTLYPAIGHQATIFPGILLQADPPEHTRLRNLLGKAFSPRVVAQFEGWIREICVRIVDQAIAAGSFDAIPMIASELPAQVIASILGVPPEDRQFIIRVTPDLFGALDPDIGYERSRQAMVTVMDYGVELAALKRRVPGTDMVTELVNGMDEAGDISEEEYRGIFLSLYTAGYETTHTLIAQSLYLMARDPEVAAQVRAAEFANMRPLVEELLRLTCPVNYWGRIATRDAEIAGQPVAKGDYVMMWFTAANRDPDFYEDPHSFKPGRKGGRTQASFGGGGPHLCIGAHLAKLEVEVLFDEMNKRGLKLELDGDASRAIGIHINALRKLPVRVAA